ncbi:hypothetical protein FB474_2977 [Oryzihumus leptocrescens]|uniref:Uncharacterized protein n=2 Tax=Oryzihumus leptocrescens TaxID=297536 RepID=A0A542ZMN9_9MICO|nr:hypothetical protein FB474_2977 [Oryzihumus leptocrescens]
MARRMTPVRALTLSLAAALAGVLAVGAATPALAAGGKRAGAPPPTPARAMWVWSADDPATVVAFARDRGVSRLFVAVPPQVTSSPDLPRLQQLSAQARAAGMQVDALGGDPGWVDSPSWAVTSWLTPALASGLFTGVHVDVEPYLLASWSTDQSGTVKRYLGLLSTLASSAGPSHPLEADIPFWFNTVSYGRTPLDRAVMTRVAGTTVMAYRNHAAGTDGTLDIAAAALASARATGRPVRIGQETNDLGSAPEEVKQTFFGMTRTQMEGELAQVDAALTGSATYAGIAVEDYRGWTAMAP